MTPVMLLVSVLHLRANACTKSALPLPLACPRCRSELHGVAPWLRVVGLATGELTAHTPRHARATCGLGRVPVLPRAILARLAELHALRLQPLAGALQRAVARVPTPTTVSGHFRLLLSESLTAYYFNFFRMHAVKLCALPVRSALLQCFAAFANLLREAPTRCEP